MIPASHGERLLIESCYRQEGSGTEVCTTAGSTTTGSTATGSTATGSTTADSDAMAPPPQALLPQAPQMVPPCTSHSHLPGVSQQPCISRWCYHLVSLRERRSLLTPPLINLWLWVVRMPRVMEGRELKAEMITPGLPANPLEHMWCPPSG